MKFSVTLLSLVLAGAVFAATPANSRQAETKTAPAAKKQAKWQGTVVRINKDQSQIDLRASGTNQPKNTTRKIAYSSSTEWTKQGKPGQQDDIKEGSFIIALGQVDSNGVLQATRIDLRQPR